MLSRWFFPSDLSPPSCPPRPSTTETMSSKRLQTTFTSLYYTGRTFEDQHMEHAGELISDDQKPYSSLVFSQPYPAKLLITPTSPPSVLSPLTMKPRMSPVVTSCAISSMTFGASGARNAKTMRFSLYLMTNGAEPSWYRAPRTPQ